MQVAKCGRSFSSVDREEKKSKNKFNYIYRRMVWFYEFVERECEVFISSSLRQSELQSRERERESEQ